MAENVWGDVREKNVDNDKQGDWKKGAGLGVCFVCYESVVNKGIFERDYI